MGLDANCARVSERQEEEEHRLQALRREVAEGRLMLTCGDVALTLMTDTGQGRGEGASA